MEVLSCGWQTDLTVLCLSGSKVEQHPTYVGGPHPRQPDLSLGQLPGRCGGSRCGRDLHVVEEAFARELPGVTHRAFGVDAPDGTRADLAAFAEAGYDVDVSVVLSRPRPCSHRRVPTPPPAAARLEGDDDWAQRVSLDLACHDGGPDGLPSSPSARPPPSAGSPSEDGDWYGAFDAGRLVGTMGIVRAGDRVARFQEVQTHPEARGRGIAGSLVHAAATDALHRLGASTLVTVADPAYHAIRIYRSLSFVESEVQLMAERR